MLFKALNEAILMEVIEIIVLELNNAFKGQNKPLEVKINQIKYTFSEYNFTQVIQIKNN
ncbi:UNVERIFIED_CONTAM: hypothetical protein O8I53_11535 [Campylobacter lari]